jgi:hypothetical protein
MTASSIGQSMIQGLAGLVGLLFICAAVRAIRSGDFTASKRIIQGNPTGVEHILRSKRPAVFWFCVIAFLIFGLVLIGSAWFVF